MTLGRVGPVREVRAVLDAPRQQGSVQASVGAYLDAVAAGREPPVTGAAALDSISLLQRIYDTAAVLTRTGPVTAPDSRRRP